VGVVEVEALDTELAQAGLGVLLDRLGPQALPVLGAGVAGLVQLDGAVDGAAVVARAAAAGVRVANLDTYRLRADAAAPGLVLGYGNLADGQVEEAVTLLAAAVAGARR
jgi:GntR family transcriptional regulator/MocR family aminotransferase